MEILDRYSGAPMPLCVAESVVANIQKDETFYRSAETLHADAMRSHLGGDAPVSDGFNIYCVDVRPNHSIQIRFQIYLFTATCGHSVIPAMYTLTRDMQSSGISELSYGCGLRDQAGEFWYPRTDKYYGRYDPFPEFTSDWAIYATKTFGEASLARHLKRNRR